MLLELGERCDPVLELPFPIVPKFGCDMRPIARRMRHELFPITIPKRLHFSKDENAKTARICVNARTGKCAPHSIALGFCPTERQRRCRLEFQRKVFAPFRPATEYSRGTRGSAAPR